MLILLISLPVGIFLSQQTQIFKPRAAAQPTFSIPEVCTPGSYALTPINYGQPGLSVSWNIPPKIYDETGKAVCNVFIHDNAENENKDYKLSSDCSGGTSLVTLHDVDNINPDRPVISNGDYTLFVSNGDPASCYNKAVANTPRITSTPSPATSLPTVIGLTPNEVKLFRSLGFYPINEDGYTYLYTRYDYINKFCPSNPSSCAPENPRSLESIKNDTTFIKDLMAKLYDRGYSPILALRPYFYDQIEDIVNKSANPEIYNTFQNGDISIIGPRFRPTQAQFKTKIEPAELKQVINEVIYDHQLALDENSLMTILINTAEVTGSARSIITIMVLPQERVAPEERLYAGLGILTSSLPFTGKPIVSITKNTILKIKEMITYIKSLKETGRGRIRLDQLFAKSNDWVEAYSSTGTLYRVDELSGTDWRGLAAGRGDLWDAERYLGPPPRNVKGELLNDSILDRTDPVPGPLDIDGRGKYRYENDVKPALERGEAAPISVPAVARPSKEITILGIKHLDSKLGTNYASNLEVLRDYDEVVENGAFYVINHINDGMAFSGGVTSGKVIVISEPIWNSSVGFHTFLHELTHLWNKIYAKVNNRPQFIGFEFKYPPVGQNPKNKDEMITVLLEFGTEINARYSQLARIASVADLNVFRVLDEAFVSNLGYDVRYPDIMRKVKQIHATNPDVVHYLRELALTGDGNLFLERMAGKWGAAKIPTVRGVTSESAIQDYNNLLTYFKGLGIDLSLVVTAVNIPVTDVEAFPVGKVLEIKDGAIIDSSVSSSQVSKIFINWNGSGGSQIFGVGAGGSIAKIEGIGTDRNTICGGKFVEKMIHIEFTNKPFIDRPIRIIGSPTLCAGVSSGAAEGITPSSPPIITTIEKPTIVDGSCNRTTLNLSWNQVSGISKYQMRGRKTNDENYYPTLNSKIDGSVDPNYTQGLDLSESAKEVLSNSDGSGVSCFGNKCAYSFSGLKNTFKYRVWVNSKDDLGNRSDNSYFPKLIDCNYQESGNTNDMVPVITSSSCTNGKVNMSWEVAQTAGPFKGAQPTEHKYHVRGLQTDDPSYFPPNNWTDGINPNRYVSNNSGDNVKCDYRTNQQGYGYARCTYSDDSTIQRTGTYRLWVDSYIPGKDNSRSVNTYINGLVNCGN